MMAGMSASSGVLSLANYSRIKVKFDVAPDDIQKISKGQRFIWKVMIFQGKDSKARFRGQCCC